MQWQNENAIIEQKDAKMESIGATENYENTKNMPKVKIIRPQYT